MKIISTQEVPPCKNTSLINERLGRPAAAAAAAEFWWSKKPFGTCQVVRVLNFCCHCWVTFGVYEDHVRCRLWVFFRGFLGEPHKVEAVEKTSSIWLWCWQRPWPVTAMATEDLARWPRMLRVQDSGWRYVRLYCNHVRSDGIWLHYSERFVGYRMCLKI